LSNPSRVGIHKALREGNDQGMGSFFLTGINDKDPHYQHS
jgi:hypothetical protein